MKGPGSGQPSGGRQMTSGARKSSHASMSPAFQVSREAHTTSTFSSDIAHAVSREDGCFRCKAARSPTLDRAIDLLDRLHLYETEGHRFESCRARCRISTKPHHHAEDGVFAHSIT